MRILLFSLLRVQYINLDNKQTPVLFDFAELGK